MKILGISAFYHDAAAALIVDGRIVAAAQEERFTRKKHDSGFPVNAIRFCLEFAGMRPADLDQVAFYDKPFLKFERLLETYLAFAPRGFTSFRQALPIWLKEKLFQKTCSRGRCATRWVRTSIGIASCYFRNTISVTLRARFIRRHSRAPPSLRWTAWASGRRLPSRWATARICRSYVKFTSRTRWGCFIRRSLITPASRSTQANTR